MEKNEKTDHPIKTYWVLYGGWRQLIRSPYVYASVVVTWLAYPLWAREDSAPWADISVSVLPNLLGFSIATLTVLLAFSDSKALRALTQRGRSDSYFVKTVANLFHFLIVQTIALTLAVIAHAHFYWPLSYLGMLFLTYAIFVSIAAAGQLLNTALIINKAIWVKEPKSRP